MDEPEGFLGAARRAADARHEQTQQTAAATTRAIEEVASLSKYAWACAVVQGRDSALGLFNIHGQTVDAGGGTFESGYWFEVSQRGLLLQESTPIVETVRGTTSYGNHVSKRNLAEFFQGSASPTESGTALARAIGAAAGTWGVSLNEQHPLEELVEMAVNIKRARQEAARKREQADPLYMASTEEIVEAARRTLAAAGWPGSVKIRGYRMRELSRKERWQRRKEVYPPTSVPETEAIVPGFRCRLAEYQASKGGGMYAGETETWVAWLLLGEGIPSTVVGTRAGTNGTTPDSVDLDTDNPPTLNYRADVPRMSPHVVRTALQEFLPTS